MEPVICVRASVISVVYICMNVVTLFSTVYTNLSLSLCICAYTCTELLYYNVIPKVFKSLAINDWFYSRTSIEYLLKQF